MSHISSNKAWLLTKQIGMIMNLYPRKCAMCGKGMNEGYLLHDSIPLCSTGCLSQYLYEVEDTCYYTEWEDEDVIDDMYDEQGNPWSVTKGE